MSTVSRRDFLKASSGAAVGAGLGLGAMAGPVRMAKADNGKKASPNEKIVMGFVGVAGRGGGHLDWFGHHPDVEIAAVCDVYEKHLDDALAKIKEKKYGDAKGYKDFRKLLERKDLDAVVVATPPHWHPLVTIYACQAGMDVYCEKPMCMTPREGRAMVKAARDNKRITQVGTQIHADENYHRTVEIVRSGVLGKITAVRTVLSLNEAPEGIGNPPDSDPPEGLDWDMWYGPLEPKPFNIARFQGGQHRYFDDLVGSWLHEMGPHIIDLPFWALEPGAPLSATAIGGRYVMKDISTVPDTMEVMFEFPDYIMTWSNMCANGHGLAFQGAKPGPNKLRDRQLGTTFHGLNATLLADYGAYTIVAEGERMNDVKLPDPSLPRSPGHEREFLDCVKSRELPSCDVEKHYPLHLALNLGNIAYKVKRKIHWDAQKEEIIGDAEANALITPHYRSPWTLPA